MKTSYLQLVQSKLGKPEDKVSKASVRKAMQRMFAVSVDDFLDEDGKPVFKDVGEIIDFFEKNARSPSEKVAVTEFKRYISDEKYDVTKILKMLGEDKIQVDVTSNGESFKAFLPPWEAVPQ